MHAIVAFVTANPAKVLLAAYVFLKITVSPMPDPKPTSSGFYLWFYGAAHTLLLNVDNIVKAKTAQNGPVVTYSTAGNASITVTAPPKA